jgi:toxin-antitoxin system PIN domain toxin
MILPDANLLLYSVNYEAPLHKGAKGWLQSALTGADTIGFAWISLIAFVRVSTNAIFPQPLPVSTALDQIDLWLEQPNAVILHPGPRHSRILRDLLSPLGTGGNLTSDAHLAALAIEHGAELCSADSDFARFAGLRWRNPLAAK